MQNKRFNREASALGDGVAVLSISVDLPFAQKRFCAAEGIDRVYVYSDHRDLDFGMKYGMVIEGLRLLTRAVVVVEAMTAMTLLDELLLNMSSRLDKIKEFYQR